jgi:hypothetical protein
MPAGVPRVDGESGHFYFGETGHLYLGTTRYLTESWVIGHCRKPSLICLSTRFLPISPSNLAPLIDLPAVPKETLQQIGN